MRALTAAAGSGPHAIQGCWDYAILLLSRPSCHTLPVRGIPH